MEDEFDAIEFCEEHKLGVMGEGITSRGERVISYLDDGAAQRLAEMDESARHVDDG